MKRLKLNTLFFVNTPETWIMHDDGNTISLYDQFIGVGALQFSFYSNPNNVAVNLIDDLRDLLLDKHSSINIQAKEGFAYTDVDDEKGTYWRYWLFEKKADIIFITYNCEKADQGKENIIVDNIVKSLGCYR